METAASGKGASGRPSTVARQENARGPRKKGLLIRQRWNRAAVPTAPATSNAMPRKSGTNSASGTLPRSEEHTSELQSLMRISYAVLCLKKKKKQPKIKYAIGK